MKQESEQTLQRIREAQYWSERVGSVEPLDEKTSAAFVDWLSASPENMRQYLLQCALHEAICASGLASRGAQARSGRAKRERDALPAFGARWAANGAEIVSWPRRLWDRYSSQLVAASILGIALAAGIATLRWRSHDDWTSYTTHANSPREVSLEDGSLISIYGNSSIAVRYSPELRAVRLDEGGGRFQVHPEAARAFRVTVPGGSFEAVGTDFNLLRKGDETGLFVTEGAVRVTGLAQPDTLVLTQGESTDLSIDGHFQPAKRYEETRLQFEASALEEMAEVFNSRNRVPQFHVEGHARKRRFGGRVTVNDPQKWIRGLESMGVFDIEQRGNVVTIRLKYEPTQ